MNHMAMYIDEFKMKHEAFLMGCDSLEELGLWDKIAYGEMDSFYTNDMTTLIIRLTASDGVITQKEVDDLNQLFDFDYTLEELREVYDNCADLIGEAFDDNFRESVAMLREISEKVAEAYKELLDLICSIIAESDGTVTEAERAEIVRIKSLCRTL